MEQPTIVFDRTGESQIFEVGNARIFFRWSDTEEAHVLTVAYAATGEPYSRTSDYLTFATEADAQAFLERALREGQLPFRWQ